MKKSIALYICLLSFGSVFSQYSLQGLVVDASNNTPLTHANILLKELSIGTTSIKNGEFSINNIPMGD